MPKIKGTNIVTLKKIFQKAGPDTEDKFLAKLSEKEADIFKAIISTSWTPIELQARFYELAAQTLYPGSPNGMDKLFIEMAENAYSGVYKIFLKIPSTQFILKRAANLWATYYDSGNAMVENNTDDSFDFIVSEFPELPEILRKAVTANIKVLNQMTGLKNAKIVENWKNPKEWRWQVTW